MATNYSKWDKIVDSDEEEEEKREAQQFRKPVNEEVMEKDRQLQETVGNWLRGQLRTLPPELYASGMRQLSDGDVRALARFMVVSHFDDNSTNLTRHRDIIDLARRDVWLEEVGTLELLSVIHQRSSQLWEPHDRNMRKMLYSAVNTLAAPKLAPSIGKGNILDLFAVIAAPKSEEEWGLRERYQRKDFAGKVLDVQKPSQPEMSDKAKAIKMIIDVLGEHGVLLIFLMVAVIFLSKLMYRYWSQGSFFGDMTRYGTHPPGWWQYTRSILEL